MTITLEQLLLSRDNRQEHQRFLLKNNPDKTLICLTVIMPGNDKRNCPRGVKSHKENVSFGFRH